MQTSSADLSAVAETTQLRRTADAAADAARAAQAEAIRRALAAGARVVDVVHVTGLSRERVYQVRDGRR